MQQGHTVLLEVRRAVCPGTTIVLSITTITTCLFFSRRFRHRWISTRALLMASRTIPDTVFLRGGHTTQHTKGKKKLRGKKIQKKKRNYGWWCCWSSSLDRMTERSYIYIYRRDFTFEPGGSEAIFSVIVSCC